MRARTTCPFGPGAPVVPWGPGGPAGPSSPAGPWTPAIPCGGDGSVRFSKNRQKYAESWFTTTLTLCPRAPGAPSVPSAPC